MGSKRSKAGNQWDMVLILLVTGEDEINTQVEGGASSRAEGYDYLLKWDLEKAGSQVWGTIQ